MLLVLMEKKVACIVILLNYEYTSSSERSQVSSTNTEFFIPFTKDKRIRGDCSHAHRLGVTHDGSELHHVAVLSGERSKD